MQKFYDICIVGGGIQGVAIAQACSAAGFSVLIVEKNDWGSATSSSSSKLIHGGLRYLQTGQFHLVRECLQERDWMIEHSPHLVQINQFYLPIYKHSIYRPWQIYLALSFYRLLSWPSPFAQFSRLRKKQWKKVAYLQQEDLQALFVYSDGQTDDKALTQAVQRSAQKLGAQCLSDTEFIGAVQGINKKEFTITLKNKHYEKIQSKLLINASGPWVNDCLSLITPRPKSLEVELMQGSHLVLSPQLSKQCFYVEAPDDQRAVFILAWQDKTLVGTTEQSFDRKPDKTEASEEEISYLYRVLHFYFPDYLYEQDAVFSGVRVLPKLGEKAFLRSRDVMFHEQDHLISIYGGKLTAWRATAETVLKMVELKLGARNKINSHDIPL